MRKRRRIFLLKQRRNNNNILFEKTKNKINPRITAIVTPGTKSSGITRNKNKNNNFYPVQDRKVLESTHPGRISRNCVHITDRYYETNKKLEGYNAFYSLGKFDKNSPITFYKWESNDPQRTYRIAYRQNAVSTGLSGVLFTPGKRKKKSNAFLFVFLLTIFGPTRSILRLLRRYLKSSNRKVRFRYIRRMLGRYNGNCTIVSNLNISNIHRKLQDATYCNYSTGTGSTDPKEVEDLKKVWRSRRSKGSKIDNYFRGKAQSSKIKLSKTHESLHLGGNFSQVNYSPSDSDDGETIYTVEDEEDALWN